jgi:transposase
MSRRRKFAPEFKAQVVLEELTGVKDRAEICREYRLRPQLLSRWREELVQRAPEVFSTERSRGVEQERIADLERMVGRLTMELDAAKKASSILTSLSSGKER